MTFILHRFNLIGYDFGEDLAGNSFALQPYVKRNIDDSIRCFIFILNLGFARDMMALLYVPMVVAVSRWRMINRPSAVNAL